jgi:hypothetical protein
MTGRTHLIWSIKWGLWHRRSNDGAACGYTDDILQAGVFETATALDYDDNGTTNRAVSLKHARERLQRAIDAAQHRVDEARRRQLAFDDKVK